MSDLKTALVTGASSGMGKAIAKQLLRDGYTVAVAARRLEAMQDLVDLGAHAVRMDIADTNSLTAAVAEIREKVGAIDILVNNAGFGLYGSVEEVPIDDARYQFEVTLFGLAHLTQLLIPDMRKAGRGKIINISSMGGRIYTPLGAWYHATKHALEGFSDCLRIELKGFGIDVVVVQPGGIDTGFADVLDGPMQKHSGEGPYKRMVERIAEGTRQMYERGRASPPELIAGVVSDAVKARRPKTRYVAGFAAKPLMWIRRWLGDRAFDRLMLSQVK